MLDIRQEQFTIDRSIDDHRCSQTIMPQGGVFKIDWQDINTVTEGEKYAVARERLGLMQTYATMPELKKMITAKDMMQVFAGMSEEEFVRILASAERDSMLVV